MKQIALQNFRCFKSMDALEFRHGINLLIGNNGSGKTSLLKACKYALSAFFSGYSDENTTWISPTNEDFYRDMANGDVLPEESIKISFQCDEHQFDTLNGVGTECSNPGAGDVTFQVEKNSRKNAKPLKNGVKDLKTYGRLLMRNYIQANGDAGTNKYAHPVFAVFTTEDIHTVRKLDLGKFKTYEPKPSFGFYENMNGDGLLEYWMKRLLVLQEGHTGATEINVVCRAVEMALGEDGCNIISGLEIRPIIGDVYVKYTDGRYVPYALLSDGYKRLLNIVIDVAIRCAILNKHIYAEDAALMSRGTILVDEIDMHLHPTLQAKVLKGLRRAFPSMQIICTTHAPMVMSGVEHTADNVVYKMSYAPSTGYKISEVDTYGMDVATITKAVLGQTPRSEEVQLDLDEVSRLVADPEQLDAGKRKLEYLKEKFGYNIPELHGLEATLAFMQEEL